MLTAIYTLQPSAGKDYATQRLFSQAPSNVSAGALVTNIGPGEIVIENDTTNPHLYAGRSMMLFSGTGDFYLNAKGDTCVQVQYFPPTPVG